MEYFRGLEEVLKAQNPTQKIELFRRFYGAFLGGETHFEEGYTPCKLNEPSYTSFLKIVPPTSLPKAKNLLSVESKKYLVHTILHIEYSAIDLALDAALRFHGLPFEYYQDWLEVADDEVRHFLMLGSLLKELGGAYGDFEVHKNLFEAMQNSTQFLERMAVVPRFLEANGLDQNPKIIQRLKSNPDEFNTKLIEALEIILEEEVSHVQKGDKWFKYGCEIEGFEPQSKYLELIQKAFPHRLERKMELNFIARKRAGFSCDELKILSGNSDCFEGAR